MTNVLRNLQHNNEYPIVFVGSGMSRRYLHEFPDWESMLGFFWSELKEERGFYSFLNELRQNIKNSNQDLSDSDIDYLTNITAGSTIEQRYNLKFFSQEITIPHFDQEKAFRTKISPFKVAVSQKFNSYKVKEEMSDEFQIYTKFLSKSQIIITTNYDKLIEDEVNSIDKSSIKKYIGQKGFFEQTDGWAEIYKIHGCVDQPDSIILSKEDYDFFDKNSILISAKIISMLINSPIIFIGYSLKDRNVRKIIKDFSSSLTAREITHLSNKIIIVEREEGLEEIIEQRILDKELGCEYTVIKTDNYSALFDILSNIDQGIPPSDVRKYQRVIKKLIVDRGRKGSLNTLLISPEALEDIENRLGDEKLIVALGDTTYIFKMPNLLSYIEDYFFRGTEIHTDIALRFVASQSSNSRIPFLKHVKDVDIEKTNLHPVEKEKIRQRILGSTGVDQCLKSIPTSYRIKAHSIKEIINMKFKPEKEFDVVSYNHDRISIGELGEYIRSRLEQFKKSGLLSLPSTFRRVLMIYDYKINRG